MGSPSETGNVLLIWARIGDYHAARFLASEKILLPNSLYISDLGTSDGVYKWKNPLSDHPNYHPLSQKPVEEPDVRARFLQFRKLANSLNIKVVGLAGYGRPEYNLILIWCRWKGIRVVLFAESWYGDNRLFNFLKGRYLARMCSALLVSGKKAKHHFQQKLGLGKTPIRIGYSVVDNKHFVKAHMQKSQNILLCVARFSPEKNLVELTKAFRSANIKEEWSLVLVGGGPLKTELEKEAALDPRVVVSDWLPYEELPNLYSNASFFILPSIFEPWGLVVNEAMSAGLPVAVSIQCGCEPDLVNSFNGFSFDANNPESIRNTIEKITETSAGQRENMGRASQDLISIFSPKSWAANFKELAMAT